MRSSPTSWAKRITWRSLISMPDIRTPKVASRNEEKRAVAVTICSKIEELKLCSSSPSSVRRGEKVPATVGTVAHRLVVGDLLSAVEVEGTVFASHDAGLATARTRLLLAEGVGLLFQEGSQSALGESGSGCRGELFQGGEVGVERGAGVAEGPTGKDFAPLSGEIMDVLEVLGRKLRACHRLSCLDVAENGKTACRCCCRPKWSPGQSKS
jgi:hypothetical protein